uniref:Uncharacterized protein n=1 Tax=Knipowitschia caucasica TaxID=637954 RepID=A0AAV2M504_KNICA
MESPLFCADVLMSSQSPGLCLNQEIPETPAIKEEQLQECSPEFIALCVKREATEMETRFIRPRDLDIHIKMHM